MDLLCSWRFLCVPCTSWVVLLKKMADKKRTLTKIKWSYLSSNSASDVYGLWLFDTKSKPSPLTTTQVGTNTQNRYETKDSHFDSIEIWYDSQCWCDECDFFHVHNEWRKNPSSFQDERNFVCNRQRQCAGRDFLSSLKPSSCSNGSNWRRSIRSASK